MTFPLAYIHHAGEARWAQIDGDMARLMRAGFRFGDPVAEETIERIELADAVILPPIQPEARVFCVGRNYRAHADEMGGQASPAPGLFQRLPESFVGAGAAVEHPGISERFDYEGEIAIVLQRGGWRLSGEAAAEAIGGVTLAIDGSVRDYQAHSLLAGKNFRRSGALGPWIVPIGDPGALGELDIETWLNGKRVQRGCLAELIHSPAALIEYLSSIVELQAGDIISTGTPAGVGAARAPPLWLKPGDRIEVRSVAIGSLYVTVQTAVFENSWHG